MTESNVGVGSKATEIAFAQAIEQYKAKLSDLGNIGVRQTAMTTYYVSIVSALFALLAFKDKSLVDMGTSVLFMVCGAGFLVSILWFYGLSFFRSLYRAKLTVLKEIEESLPFQTFSREFELMSQSGITSWLWIERLVPAVFSVLFGSIILERVFQLLCRASAPS